MTNRVAVAAEYLASCVRAGLQTVSDLVTPAPLPALAGAHAASSRSSAVPASDLYFRADTRQPPSGPELPQADPVEAWALASALEVLANYFDAHAGGGGVQFRAVVNAAIISAEYGVGDAVGDRLRGWALAIKAPIAAATGGNSMPADRAIFIWDPVAEAERTVREAQDNQQYRERLDRWIAIFHEIEALAAPGARMQVGKLCNELDAVHGDAMIEAEDRVLHIAADVLKDAEQWALFARIFARFSEDSYYETGDEVDFYYRRNRGSNVRADSRRREMRVFAAERQALENAAGTLPKPTTELQWEMYVSTALGGHAVGDATCAVDDCGARADGPYPKECPDGCGGLMHSGSVVGAEWAKCERCQYRSDPMRWSWGEDGRLIERTWREIAESGELES